MNMVTKDNVIDISSSNAHDNDVVINDPSILNSHQDGNNSSQVLEEPRCSIIIFNVIDTHSYHYLHHVILHYIISIISLSPSYHSPLHYLHYIISIISSSPSFIISINTYTHTKAYHEVALGFTHIQVKDVLTL